MIDKITFAGYNIYVKAVYPTIKWELKKIEAADYFPASFTKVVK